MGLDKKGIVNLVYVHIASLNAAILAEEKLNFDGNTFEGQYSSISKNLMFFLFPGLQNKENKLSPVHSGTDRQQVVNLIDPLEMF